MKYGFIGVGNMASSIIKGMTSPEGGFDGKDIYGYNRTISKAEALSQSCKINCCLNIEEAVEYADIIVIGIKPNGLSTLLPLIKNCIGNNNPLIISLAVGKTLDYLQQFLEMDIPIARVMPNINAKVGAATSCYCVNKYVSNNQKQLIEKLFGTIGSITEIDESLFSIFGVLAGSAPAFAYYYIDSLSRAAQKAGMSRPQALKTTAQAVLGSAKMILESNEHPWELIDQVCSPGGTTIEGIATLTENQFPTAITKAFDAVLNKDEMIQKKQ